MTARIVGMIIPRRRYLTLLFLLLSGTMCSLSVYLYRSVSDLSLPVATRHNVVNVHTLPSKIDVSNLIRNSADDKNLTIYVKKNMLVSPSAQIYNLTNERQRDFSSEISFLLDSCFNEKEDGVFVDVGSNDGESHSISLFFERSRNWTGVLVEKDPVIFQHLKWKNRHVYLINTCIRMTGSTYNNDSCLWLETILLALGYFHIDLLNINDTDHELNILLSIPFKKTEIKAITVEFNKTHSFRLNIISYLYSNGYKLIHQFEHHIYEKVVLIFMKK